MEGRRATLVWIALVAILVAGCGNAAPSEQATATPCPRVIAPQGLEVTLLPQTTCALPQYDAARFRQLLGQLRGVPVVVNIWGSWCGPCLEEAPDLARVAGEFRDRVQFIGVDINDLRVPAQNFIRRFEWPYPSVFDPPGAIRDSLGLVCQPHTVVFDAAGKRTLVHAGAITARQLRRELQRVSAPPAP